MSQIIIGKAEGRNVALDLDVLLRTRLLIQASSGQGKSWLIRRIAEQAFGKVQILIIDSEGEFASLREKFFFLLVGPGGETPADVRSAAKVAEKMLELRANAICDIFELKHAKHAWVRAFLSALIDASKKLWHPALIIVDEAHKFCPEGKAGQSEAADAMIDLATAGRKRGFCAIFATQRLGKLRKDASAELLNRLVGGTFEDLDVERAADELSVPRSDRAIFRRDIKVLEAGQFFALGRAVSKERIRLTVGAILTSHPEAGSTKHAAEPPPAPEKIRALLPKLADLPKAAEEEARTLAELKQQIRGLKAQLRAQPKAAPIQRIQPAERHLETQLRRQYQDVAHSHGRMARAGTRLAQQLAELAENMAKTFNIPVPKPVLPKLEDSRIHEKLKTPVSALPASLHSMAKNNGELPGGEREVLKVIAKYQDGVKRDQVSILSGYKRSTRDAYLARLRTKSLIDERAGNIFITEAGILALGDHYETFPDSGEELQRYWLNKLPEGEKKLLQIMLQDGDRSTPFDREFLSEATGYKRSTRDAYLSRMAARKIIETIGPGQVKASEAFFQ
jgi:hypothetical protein